MSKILKNNTANSISISDTGVTISASPAQYTIQPQDYLLWAASNDIVGRVGSEDIIVNDGSSDLSINNGIKLIQGIFPNPVGIASGNNLTPIGHVGDQLKVVTSSVAPGEFMTFKSSTTVNLTSDVTFETLHLVSGSGSFIGATFVVDGPTAECQIVIDGNIIFDFSGSFLSDVVNKDSDYKASGIFGVTNDGKRLFCTPTTPFNYHTELLFRARKSGRKVNLQLYTYSVI